MEDLSSVLVAEGAIKSVKFSCSTDEEISVNEGTLNIQEVEEVELCRNASMGLCQCEMGEWKNFESSMWNVVKSQRGNKFIDVKLTAKKYANLMFSIRCKPDVFYSGRHHFVMLLLGESKPDVEVQICGVEMKLESFFVLTESLWQPREVTQAMAAREHKYYV